MLQGAVGVVWAFAATAEAKTSAPPRLSQRHINGVGVHLQRGRDRTGSAVAVTIEEEAPFRTDHCGAAGAAGAAAWNPPAPSAS